MGVRAWVGVRVCGCVCVAGVLAAGWGMCVRARARCVPAARAFANVRSSAQCKPAPPLTTLTTPPPPPPPASHPDADDLPPWLEYQHVQLVAKIIPPREQIDEVVRVATRFWAAHPDMYIAIHCAYGGWAGGSPAECARVCPPLLPHPPSRSTLHPTPNTPPHPPASHQPAQASTALALWYAPSSARPAG